MVHVLNDNFFNCKNIIQKSVYSVIYPNLTRIASRYRFPGLSGSKPSKMKEPFETSRVKIS